MQSRGLSFVEILIATLILIVASIGLAQLFSGTAHKINFSTQEINCANLAMQILDFTEKSANNNTLDKLVSTDSEMMPFPVISLPGSKILSVPDKVQILYNLAKPAAGYKLLLEVRWVDKTEHKVRYGRFYPTNKL